MPRPVLGNYDGAVVNGFFVFGTGSGGGLAPPQILKSDEMLKATLLYVSRSSSSSSTAVLRTIASTCMGGAEQNTGTGTPPD